MMILIKLMQKILEQEDQEYDRFPSLAKIKELEKKKNLKKALVLMITKFQEKYQFLI